MSLAGLAVVSFCIIQITPRGLQLPGISKAARLSSFCMPQEELGGWDNPILAARLDGSHRRQTKTTNRLEHLTKMVRDREHKGAHLIARMCNQR